MTTLLLILLLTVATAWAVHRDVQRAVRRRELERRLAAMAESFAAFQRTIGEALLPALTAAVPVIARIGEAFREAGLTKFNHGETK